MATIIVMTIMENLDVSTTEAEEILDDLKETVNEYIHRGEIESAEEELYEYGIEMDMWLDLVS